MRTRAGDAFVSSIPTLATTNQTIKLRAGVSCVVCAVRHRISFELNHLSLTTLAALCIPMNGYATGFPLPCYLLCGAIPHRFEIVASTLYPLSWTNMPTYRLPIV